MAEDLNLNELQMIFDAAEAKRKDIDAKAWQYLDRVSRLPELVDKYDAEFERLTGIQRKDWSFLVFASALHCVRVILSDMIKDQRQL